MEVVEEGGGVCEGGDYCCSGRRFGYGGQFGWSFGRWGRLEVLRCLR